MSFARAEIDGVLECNGGQFNSNGETPALNLIDAEAKRGVYLRDGFKAKGGVNLQIAKIAGNLDCTAGQFIGTSKTPALNANGVKVTDNIFLNDGFRAEGEVNLVTAEIEANLDCGGGQFIGNAKTPALNVSAAKMEGVANLNAGFAAEGDINFVAAQANLGLQWSGVRSPEKVSLDLRLSKVGRLLNSRNSWPNQGHLRLDGFVYDQISDLAPPNAEVQLGWLQRQPQDRFLSQPFEQLATVLRNMGLEEDAQTVMIAKNEEHARYVRWRPEWLWYGLFGHLIGYGYSPWRAFFISLAMIGIGWLLFWRGYRRGLITPTSESAYGTIRKSTRHVLESYPKFNAFIYSHWRPSCRSSSSE